MTQEPDWGAVYDANMAKATAALRPGMTDDELVAVVRDLADDMRAIPPRVRAVAAITTTAERLVEVLTDAGVEFADVKLAPVQLAASMVAAWMQSDQRARDAGEWADMVACLPDAIEWARWNGTEAEPWACETVRQCVEGDTP